MVAVLSLRVSLLLLLLILLIVVGFLADVAQQRIVDTSGGDFVKAVENEQNPSKVVGSRQM
jgi:hypothetical protein